jgi:serine/threonine protein kinase
MEVDVMLALKKNPHPNVVELFHFFQDDSFYYLEMGLHGSGIDLFDYIDSNPNMSESDMRDIFKQIVLGIQHLHKLSIVHRDIKVTCEAVTN